MPEEPGDGREGFVRPVVYGGSGDTAIEVDHPPPVPKGWGVRHSSRRRTLQEPGRGSQNSSSLRSDQARFSVNISMNSIMFNKVSPRLRATRAVYAAQI